MVRNSIGPWVGIFSVMVYILVSCGEESKPVCNATTCPTGCCTVTGDCAPGDTQGQCGTAGTLCTSCQVGICTAGKCVTCDAASCPDGCCDKQQCQPGNLPTMCGKGGQACVSCQGNQQCQLGACVLPVLCDAGSCPIGCCQGDQCMPGNTEAACGTGGQVCSPCQPPVTTCVNQSCQGKQCNASTCPDGCCDAQDQCLPGNLVTACGKTGVPCAECIPGDECSNKECLPPGGCGLSNCPNGCCEGATCKPGTDMAACGTAGAKCEVCKTFQTCSGGCKIDPAQSFDVTVVSAEIAKPPVGKVWDPNAVPGFEPPDPYIQITAGTASGKTDVGDNTYDPMFNDLVFTTTAQNLLGQTKIDVFDDELIGGPQAMGSCTITIPTADLASGGHVVSNCGGLDVVKITLSFTAN